MPSYMYLDNDNVLLMIHNQKIFLCNFSSLKNLFLIQIQNVSNDSDEYPIQYGGLNLCAIAESLLKKLSPLKQLTKDEISVIRAKIENPDGEIVLGRGQRKKNIEQTRKQHCKLHPRKILVLSLSKAIKIANCTTNKKCVYTSNEIACETL